MCVCVYVYKWYCVNCLLLLDQKDTLYHLSPSVNCSNPSLVEKDNLTIFIYDLVACVCMCVRVFVIKANFLEFICLSCLSNIIWKILQILQLDSKKVFLQSFKRWKNVGDLILIKFSYDKLNLWVDFLYLFDKSFHLNFTYQAFGQVYLV